jgi:hypothetical protein
MSVYVKDKAAVVDYTVDWGAGYLAGETVVESEFAVEPVETGGLDVDSESHDGQRASATLSGGIEGHVYRVSNRIGTSGGREDERSLTIRIGAR